MPPKGDGVFKRKGREGWYASFYDQHGKRKLAKLDARTRNEAIKLRASLLHRVEQAKILGITPPSDEKFSALADKYLAYQRPRLTPKAYERTSGIVRQHLIPFFKGKAAQVKRQTIQKYVTKRLAAVSAHSVKKELDIIKHIFKLAIEWEIVPISPAQGIASPRVPPGRVRYLDPSELGGLLNSAPAWLRPIVIFAIGTGARRSSIVNLKWQDVSEDRITFARTKSNRRHVLPQNDMSRFALAMVWNPSVQSADYVFCPPTDDNRVSVEFRRACRRAQIKDMRLHDLRHTCASWLAMKGEDIRTIAQILDHSDIRMTMRYSHLSPSYLQESVKSLDAAFGPETYQPQAKLLTEGDKS